MIELSPVKGMKRQVNLRKKQCSISILISADDAPQIKSVIYYKSEVELKLDVYH